MESRILKPALAVYVGLFLLFLYGPFIVLGILSFQQGPEGGPQFPITQWSSFWYRDIFGLTPPSRIAPLPIGVSLFRSLVLAGMTMITSTVLGVMAAQAALDNIANQVELQYATIAQGEAQRASAEAHQVEAGEEKDRQETLSKTDAGTHQKLEQAVADYARAQADVRASRAVIAAQRHQLEVLSGTRKQRAADLEAAKANLAAAKLKLGYARIVAPFDGVVGERLVQPGDYVNIGTNLIDVVPLPNVYVIANYKETQLTHVRPGQSVDVTVDSFPGERLHGRVERRRNFGDLRSHVVDKEAENASLSGDV